MKDLVEIVRRDLLLNLKCIWISEKTGYEPECARLKIECKHRGCQQSWLDVHNELIKYGWSIQFVMNNREFVPGVWLLTLTLREAKPVENFKLKK